MNTCRTTNCSPSSRSRSLYRSRDGWIFGVCKGIADYADLPVLGVRAMVVLMIVLTAFLPVALAYLVAAIFMKPAPLVEPKTEEDWDLYSSYTSNREAALSRLKRRMQNLERRARRMETIVTDKEFDWESRLQSDRSD